MVQSHHYLVKLDPNLKNIQKEFMETRNQPESSYLQNAEWQELHVHTSHWQSDMSFFGDELRFIDTLFDKYFTAFIEGDNMQKTKLAASKVSHVQSDHKKLAEHIADHLRSIEDLIKNPSVENASALRVGHTSLEEDIAEFSKAFKELKREVFDLTERIAKSEKAKHLISK
jgi:hypothetical protein